MVVTPRHNNGQADGKVVYFQPLDGWNNVSNLVDLVTALSAMFTRMPPCQAKPAGYGAQQVSTTRSGRIEMATTLTAVYTAALMERHRIVIMEAITLRQHMIRSHLHMATKHRHMAAKLM